MDNDAYGHVNNVVYYSYFDTVVNRYLIEAGALDIERRRVIGLVVETHCNYFSSLAFPQMVEAGLRVAGSARPACATRSACSPPARHRARPAATSFTSTSIARRGVPVRVAGATSSSFARIAVTPNAMIPTAEQTAAVDAAITTRRSLRAFLPTPVPRAMIEEILGVAARAPSGTNTQPWKVYVLTGTSKTELSRKIMAAHNDPAERATHTEEYDYYPTEWKSPFIDRRRKVGWDLYGLLDIAKTDKARMHAQHGRNYEFFDAPVGLMFTIDRIMQAGQLARLRHVPAKRHGRGAWPWPGHLPTGRVHAVPPHHRRAHRLRRTTSKWCAACRWATPIPAAVENTLVTERDPVSAFATFPRMTNERAACRSPFWPCLRSLTLRRSTEPRCRWRGAFRSSTLLLCVAVMPLAAARSLLVQARTSATSWRVGRRHSTGCRSR